MKRRSIVLALIVAFFATFLGISRPATASGCTTVSGSYSTNAGGNSNYTMIPGVFTFVGDSVSATLTSANGDATGLTAALYVGAHASGSASAGAGAHSLSAHFTSNNQGIGQVIFNSFGGTGNMNWTATFCHGGGGSSSSSGGNQVTWWGFTDGRLNGADGAQTAAVYCEGNGDITVYAVIDSVGHWVFRATKAEIAAVPLKPAKNTLIKAAENVSLYRLVGGKLQINAPAAYVFNWDGCAAS